MLRAAVLGIAALASCVPVTPPTRALPDAALPALRRFEGTPDPTPPYSNAALARDVMELSFTLETGRALPVLTRFEGPITVAVERVGDTDPPATLSADLDALLGRLRREAGIDIRRAAGDEAASITVSALPRAALRRSVPDAACFVVPRVQGWRAFLADRRTDAMDWTTLDRRRRATVVLPADVSPQEVRDCLHEEVAQALGPLGDLYRLDGSIFNDDNLHVALTDRDMAVLRATYDPALRSGMTPAQVAARLPAILDRTNPRGRRQGHDATAAVPAAWTPAIRAALSPARRDGPRRAAAWRAVALTRGLDDERLALSHLALGRAALGNDAGTAIEAFLEAGRIYRARGGDGVPAAHVALQLGAFALSAGQADTARQLVDRAVPAAAGAQNAVLLAQLLLIRAEALTLLGRPGEADGVRHEALAWGRYAWNDADLAERVARIAALSPAA